MTHQLTIGETTKLSFAVTDSKTVPNLYPESPEFSQMPSVFATGYMVGLMEWCCMLSLKPSLKEGQGCLGVLINVSHIAPTLPGSTVTVEATIKKIEGRQVFWDVKAYDELDLIGEGTIGRAIVSWDRFQEKLEQKKMELRTHS